jgi:regulator of sigma E protease
MLGQDDMDPTKISNDPHAFNQRPIWQRMCIVSAGVIMNVIFAAVAFSIIFSPGIGVDFPPAVIGNVVYDSPAAKAGLQIGDEVTEIDGWKPHGFLEFTDLQIAAALSSGNQPIQFTIKRTKEDGASEVFTKELLPEGPVAGNKGFLSVGVMQMQSLNIVRLQEHLDEEIAQRKKDAPDEVAQIEKLRPRDRITAVDGHSLSDYLQLYRYMQAGGPKPLTLTVTNPDPKIAGDRQIILAPHIEPELGLPSAGITVLGIGPQLAIKHVNPGGAGDKAGLKDNDIILRLGDRSNPSPEQASAIVRSMPRKPLEIVVERDGKPVTIKAVPAEARGSGFLNIEWDVDDSDHLRVVLRDTQSPAAQNDILASGAAVDLLKIDGKPAKKWRRTLEKSGGQG